MTIHTNVPLPPRIMPLGFRGNAGPRPNKYDLDKLDVGQAKETIETDQRKVQASISRYRKTHPETKFTCRTMTDGKVWIWRVE